MGGTRAKMAEFLVSCAQHTGKVILQISGTDGTVKVKVHTLDIAPLRSESPPQKRSGKRMIRMGAFGVLINNIATQNG